MNNSVKFLNFPKNVADSAHIQNVLNDNKIFESDNPDYVFYSCFGYDYLQYKNAVRIFYTGECLTPDFNMCDYAIGFDRMQYNDRYCRVPLYYFYEKDYQLAKERHTHAAEILREKRSFCSFTVSNDNGQKEREVFFKLLNQYKKVDSGGRFLNNTGTPVIDKMAFDRRHKFSITFENCCFPGYVTEKIIQAFAAGCIPIYYGAPDVGMDFNKKAFIDCRDFDSFTDVVAYVKKIDENPALYEQILREPIFEQEPEYGLSAFLNNIFSQKKEESFRRAINTHWNNVYENANKRLAHGEKIRFVFQRGKNLVRRIKNKAL